MNFNNIKNSKPLIYADRILRSIGYYIEFRVNANKDIEKTSIRKLTEYYKKYFD